MKLNGYQIVSQFIDENIGYLPEPKPGQSTIIRPVAQTLGTVKGAVAGGLVGGPVGMIAGGVAGNRVAGAMGSAASRAIHSVKPLAKQALAAPDSYANRIIPNAYQYKSPGVM